MSSEIKRRRQAAYRKGFADGVASMAITNKPSPGNQTITGETARGERCELPPPSLSRDLLGKIVDDVFDGAMEDASVIEDIYAAIKRHETPSPETHVATPADNRHDFIPNKKFPWFCAHCGYAPHEPLKHFQPSATKDGSAE